MSWIWNSLVHTVIIMAFLFFAIVSENVVFGGLLVLGAALFFYRSVNHPDYFFRRAIVTCLNAGLAHLMIFNLPAESLSQISNEALKNILTTLSLVLNPTPWVGWFLIGAAGFFGALEVLRLTVLKGRRENAKLPHIQLIKEPEEVFDPETRSTTIKMVFVVRNPTKTAIDVTNPKIVRRGVWPRAKRATMQEYRGEIVDPSRPIDRQTISENNGKCDLLLTAHFKWWQVWSDIVSSQSLGFITKRLFGERRATIRTKIANGFSLSLFDTHPD